MRLLEHPSLREAVVLAREDAAEDVYCSSLAYVVLHALRRLGLVGTDLARAQCQTTRLTLLKIGARLRVTVRNVWLALATGCPHAALFARVHATLVALPMRC